MTTIIALKNTIAGLLQNGGAVALEGFTHLIPFAAGHEPIRQRKKALTSVRMTPDVIYSQLIGMGHVAERAGVLYRDWHAECGS